MKFWQIFSEDDQTIDPNLNTIYEEMKKHFSNFDDQKLAKMASISSIMSRVAHVDLNICEDEQKAMAQSIVKWFGLSQSNSLELIDLVIHHTKVLSGIENHLYARELNKVLSKADKENLIKTLFAIGAADGVVSTIEENEIYTITKELHLSQKDFVAAKMTVLEFLGALKKQ